MYGTGKRDDITISIIQNQKNTANNFYSFRFGEFAPDSASSAKYFRSMKLNGRRVFWIYFMCQFFQFIT